MNRHVSLGTGQNVIRREALLLDKVPFDGTISSMNTRNQKTLAAIFARPTLSDLRWEDIMALFHALDAASMQGEDRGSGFSSTVWRPRSIDRIPDP